MPKMSRKRPREKDLYLSCYTKDHEWSEMIICSACQRGVFTELLIGCAACGCLVCERCREPLAKTPNAPCPSCSDTPIIWAKQRLLAKFLKYNPFVNFKCPYAGCGNQSCYSDTLSHLTECVHRPYECFYEECTWQGDRSTLIEHYIDVHHENISEIDLKQNTTAQLQMDTKKKNTAFDVRFKKRSPAAAGTAAAGTTGSYTDGRMILIMNPVVKNQIVEIAVELYSKDRWGDAFKLEVSSPHEIHHKVSMTMYARPLPHDKRSSSGSRNYMAVHDSWSEQSVLTFSITSM
jgi:hypothetical protein